jgi:uncharacterized membrane protein YkvA (DUF1232 family)
LEIRQVDSEAKPVSLEQTVIIDLNPDERRLWDRMRQQVVSSKSPGEASGVGDLLFLLPDLTVLAMRLMRDDRVPLAAKAIMTAGVAYVISPLDFMPALLFGPLGLVDDLLIIAAALSGILNRVHPDVVRSHWSGQGDALEAIHQVTGWVERQVLGGLSTVMSRVLRR